MKKRLLSLFLALLMTFSACLLIACGAEDDPSSGDTPITITLYSIKEEGTTEEGIRAAEEAINLLINNAYSVNIKLCLYTAEEYDQVIAEKLQKNKEAKDTKKPGGNKGVILTSQQTGPRETTIIDGFSRLVFPEATENQLDIFLIHNQTTYMEYITGSYLTALDSMLQYDYATVRKFVAPTLLNSMKIDGKTYAIPNNHILGNYTYLLLNKTLVDAGEYDTANMTDLYALQAFLTDVAENYKDYAPLFNCPEVQAAEVAENSGIGTLITSDTTMEANAPKVLIAQEAYAKFLAAKKAYTELGYITYGNFTTNTKAGAAFVTGTPDSISAQYGDQYYVVPFAEPTANTSDIFSSMYAISTYSIDSARAMQILSLLTTDEDVRNALQYGAENITYTVDRETGLIHSLGNYNMNPLYTGNRFLLKNNDTMSDSELTLSQPMTYAEVVAVLGDACKDVEWVGKRDYALAKSLNNAATLSPYFGFNLATTEATQKLLSEVRDILEKEMTSFQARTFEDYKAKNPDATVADYVNDLYQSLLTTGEFYASTNPQIRQAITKSNGSSFFDQYETWYKKQHPEEEPPAQTEKAA